MIATAFYFAIFVSLLAGIYRAPGAAVAAVLCMFGLEQWAQAMVPFFTRNSSFTNIMVGLLVVLGLVLRIFRERGVSIDYSTVGWLVLILYFYAFTSMLWTPDIERALGLWSERMPYIITILLLAPLLVNSLADMKGMVWGVLLLGATLVILTLVFGEWSGRKIVLAGAMEEESGGNPLALSQMAGYVAFAAIFMPVMKAAFLHRVLRWLLVAACLMLAVKSGSRGQSFGILLIAVFFLMFTLPAKGGRGALWNTAAIGAVLLLGGWALTNFAETERWTSAGMEASGSRRWDPAMTMLTHWYSSPEAFFFGLGNSAAYDTRIIGWYPHVVPVEILTEEGLVGFGLFAAIICLAIRSLIRGYRMVRQDQTSLGVLLTLGAWFFYELFLSFKQGSMLGTLLLFLFATMLNRYEKITIHTVMLEPSALRSSWAWK